MNLNHIKPPVFYLIIVDFESEQTAIVKNFLLNLGIFFTIIVSFILASWSDTFFQNF